MSQHLKFSKSQFGKVLCITGENSREFNHVDLLVCYTKLSVQVKHGYMDTD